MAAVLQAVLIGCTPIRDYFLRGEHEAESCKRVGGGPPMEGRATTCVGCMLDATVQSMFAPGAGIAEAFTPSQALFASWKVAEHLASSGQHDAHEYLMALLDAIHSHCGELSNARSTSLGGPCSCIVHSSFGTKMRSVLTCGTCGHASRRDEQSLVASLEIPQRAERISLGEMVAQWTAEERFESGGFVCSGCKKPQDEMTKQVRFAAKCMPQIMCLHVKRFESSLANGSSKIATPVAFGTELDFGPYTNGAEGPLWYRLAGVIVHHGKSVDNGHYTAFVKVKHLGAWICADDKLTWTVSEGEVLQCEPYLMFYEKVV